MPGRKRHIVTDTLGLLLAVAVTAANVGDRDAAVPLLRRLRTLHREITLVWADGGYTGGLVGWAKDKLALTLQVVKRTDDMNGFVVLPRRWVVERTFAWLMHSRRLARDYETLSFFRVATDRVMAGPKHVGCHIGGLAVAVAGAACVGLDQLNTVVTDAG